MYNSNLYTTLFLDIGDVLLSNGWGHESRQAAAKEFDLDYGEMQSRHKLLMATFEEEKLIEHRTYIDKNGEDLPEIRNWKWNQGIK